MEIKISITKLCDKAGMSRQNYYKGKKERKTKEVDARLIVELVRTERSLQPRIGSKKLYIMLKEELHANGIEIGRDKFLKILKDNGLHVPPLPKSPRTTNSNHSLPVFTNKLKDMEITGPNQAWVSDITYIRTFEDFLYLSLITDVYSRKIVGYYVANTLEASDCLKSLKKALKDLPAGAHPMHHSDRGSQYCSHKYIDALQKYGMNISMTEELHCYENAMAERVNGILKQEYYLGGTFRTKQQAIKAIEQAIMLYNTKRPHTALKYKTPEEMHSKVA